jgi:hypothetical protein
MLYQWRGRIHERLQSSHPPSFIASLIIAEHVQQEAQAQPYWEDEDQHQDEEESQRREAGENELRQSRFTYSTIPTHIPTNATYLCAALRVKCPSVTLAR